MNTEKIIYSTPINLKNYSKTHQKSEDYSLDVKNATAAVFLKIFYQCLGAQYQMDSVKKFSAIFGMYLS